MAAIVSPTTASATSFWTASTVPTVVRAHTIGRPSGGCASLSRRSRSSAAAPAPAPASSSRRVRFVVGIAHTMHPMRIVMMPLVAAGCTVVLMAQSAPQHPAETLLDRATLQALDDELSGVAAKDHVARLTQLHRVPASPGFHDAIAYVMERAKAFG